MFQKIYAVSGFRVQSSNAESFCRNSQSTNQPITFSCANKPNYMDAICAFIQDLVNSKFFVTKQSSQHMYIVRGQEVQHEKYSE